MGLRTKGDLRPIRERGLLGKGKEKGKFGRENGKSYAISASRNDIYIHTIALRYISTLEVLQIHYISILKYNSPETHYLEFVSVACHTIPPSQV